MSDTALRSGLVRLAYNNPELRSALLPILKKHAGVDAGVAEAEAKHVASNLARVLAAKVGGTVGDVSAHTYDDTGFGNARVVVPNLPSMTSDEGELEVEVSFLPGTYAVIRFNYRLEPTRLKMLAQAVGELSVGVENPYPSMQEAVQAAMKSIQALPALLEPAREAEALRRKAAGTFKKVMPELREWVQKALVQSGFAEPVTVVSHPFQGGFTGGALGTMLTDAGAPFAAEYFVIDGLIGEEGRDTQISRAVLARVRDVLAKALRRFSSNGVVAKLTSKPAYWSSYRYHTTIILYFKDAPVENMKLAGKRKRLPPKGKQSSVKTAGEHPLGRMAIVYFDLTMEDYNIEEDANNGDEFAQRILNDPDEGSELESNAVKSLSRMFATRIMEEGHGPSGLVCKFSVDSWIDVKKALDVINRNHEGGDDQIGTNVPYMKAQGFRLYPDGVNGVFYGDESGAIGSWDEWLDEHKGKGYQYP